MQKLINTNHICDIKDLSVHGLLVVTGCWGEPQFLECLVHQFLHWRVVLLCI